MMMILAHSAILKQPEVNWLRKSTGRLKGDMETVPPATPLKACGHRKAKAKLRMSVEVFPLPSLLFTASYMIRKLN
jgi:hypothetical protein